MKARTLQEISALPKGSLAYTMEPNGLNLLEFAVYRVGERDERGRNLEPVARGIRDEQLARKIAHKWGTDR